MIVQMSGGQVLELSDECSPVGHLITSIGTLINDNTQDEAYEIYMETPQPETQPLLAYVPLSKDNTPEFEKAIFMPLEKARVCRVSN
jgi:hypothetical protein